MVIPIWWFINCIFVSLMDKMCRWKLFFSKKKGGLYKGWAWFDLVSFLINFCIETNIWKFWLRSQPKSTIMYNWWKIASIMIDLLWFLLVDFDTKEIMKRKKLTKYQNKTSNFSNQYTSQSQYTLQSTKQRKN